MFLVGCYFYEYISQEQLQLSQELAQKQRENTDAAASAAKVKAAATAAGRAARLAEKEFTAAVKAQRRAFMVLGIQVCVFVHSCWICHFCLPSNPQ